MFRRLSNSLPKDPVIPTDLESLGYFINDNDQIRMITNPEQKYQYHINRNERVNDLYKEAMNTCIRKLVSERLQNLGLEVIRLPLGTASNEPHVPILVSKDIGKKKRVIVLFGDKVQDQGVFSYRTIGENGIRVGSAVEFCNAILHGPTLTSEEDTPGIILTNPGQLLWYRGKQRAITWGEWVNLPRESAVHEPFRVDPDKNTVPGNRDYVEHVSCVIEHIMDGMCAVNATFDIIGLDYTGRTALKYLANHWSSWSTRIAGICLGCPQHTMLDLVPDNSDSEAFADFVGKRCRAYFVSDTSVETLMTGRADFGCNCYSSGEDMYPENIIVKAWRSMLDWFNIIHASPEFEEVEYVTKYENTANGDLA